MSTDLDDRLSALRPEPQLSTDERDAMLGEILATDRSAATAFVAPRSRRRRRVVIGTAMVGVAAAAAVVVPSVTPSDAPGGATPAAAAELHRLATVIEHHRSFELGPHQYWYVDSTLTQVGVFGDPAAGARRETLVDRSLSWTDRHGSVWRRDLTTDGRGVHRSGTLYFPGDVEGTVKYFDSLPTDAKSLREHLRSHASGSDSVDEAVFVAIEPILQSGVAAPQLRSAAVQVLAETDYVSVVRGAHDSLGRMTDRFDFNDPTDPNRPDTVQSIYFDPRTAVVLETTDIGPGTHNVEIVHDARVTGSVPPDVRRSAVTQN